MCAILGVPHAETYSQSSITTVVERFSSCLCTANNCTDTAQSQVLFSVHVQAKPTHHSTAHPIILRNPRILVLSIFGTILRKTPCYGEREKKAWGHFEVQRSAANLPPSVQIAEVSRWLRIACDQIRSVEMNATISPNERIRTRFFSLRQYANFLSKNKT